MQSNLEHGTTESTLACFAFSVLFSRSRRVARALRPCPAVDLSGGSGVAGRGGLQLQPRVGGDRAALLLPHVGLEDGREDERAP